MTPTDIRTKMLAALYKAAKAGEECPTNADLARLAKCGVGTAIKTIAALEADGAIVVVRTRNFRVVRFPTCSTARQPAPFYNQPTRMDELAEHVAEGATVQQAALAMGITDDHAMKMWRIIVAGLGRQAA